MSKQEPWHSDIIWKDCMVWIRYIIDQILVSQTPWYNWQDTNSEIILPKMFRRLSYEQGWRYQISIDMATSLRQYSN